MPYKIKQIVTSIAHWYNSSYLEENNITPEPGAYIRSRIQVSSKKVSQQIREEEARLAKLYPEARLYVVPKIDPHTSAEVELSGSSDTENVETYVAATMPENARFSAKQVIAYLGSRLGPAVEAARANNTRFIGGHAVNVLSFKEVKWKYANQGLVLLRGVNEDWPGQSNGAGKSAFLSMLQIGLFGTTQKGQKNDGWAKEDTDATATIAVNVRTGDGLKSTVRRNRRPHGISFEINGRDVSSGLTGKGKQETQGQIEETLGFDLQLLLNSVYIDQTITNGFVFGTQKGRMDLIGKIYNLSRFETASKRINKDLDDHVKARDKVEAKVESLESDLANAQDELSRASSTKRVIDWQVKLETITKEYKRLKLRQDGLSASKQFYESMLSDIDDIGAEIATEEQQLIAAKGQLAYWQKEEQTASVLIDEGKCSRCGQPSKSIGSERLKKAQENTAKFGKSVELHSKASHSLKIKYKGLVDKLKAYDDQVRETDSAIDTQSQLKQQYQQAAEQEAEQNKLQSKRIKSLSTEVYRYQSLVKGCRQRLADLDVDIEMLGYAAKAVHRSGMPLYLAAGLCPVLNRSAQEYAEIFNGGKLSVRFDIIDGEFTVDIYNPSGSKVPQGQSVGESAMAGVVAAFALREVTPKTNLLILDEPGSGLDSKGALAFAKGLLQVADRYETLLITTHNEHIESVLMERAKVWTVRKRKGISTLCTS